MTPKNHPDFLRSPDEACKPDPRNRGFLVHTPDGTRPFTIEDHHSVIAELVLHDEVPEAVRIHFETTKNIYLYCWFVYRFYPIALHYALVSLELALRERFEAEMITNGEKKREHGPGLSRLLEYAIEGNHLQNDKFKIWRHRTEMRARGRTSHEQLLKMIRENLTELECDEDAFEITDADRDHDMLESLPENLPALRNRYAHGSKSLHNHALGTIRIVSEIINQVFPQPKLTKEL